MIDLYYWPTPNGWKITILFEELGLDYKIIPVNIIEGDQFAPDFLKIAPNNRMPAIVDPDGADGEPISIFESGAILLHYAEKHKRFIPADERGRVDVLQWLFFQMGNVGPMLGQCHHFRNYAEEKLEYAIDRYTREATRLYRVVDTRLADRDYVAGDYSIADMALFSWMRVWKNQGQTLEDFPHLSKWIDRMYQRPAVRRGLDVMKDEQAKKREFTEEQRSVMFGDKQFSAR
ncbi:MAG: glutathione binding-like protein [Proteobacteria bacterium]|nr:glutathione binding-like protein [Pseudomonadota bacterium]MDA1355221.1 glutathione binding-like protein [Pseudomonadota bacterium]